jgi:hypothetical protein
MQIFLHLDANFSAFVCRKICISHARKQEHAALRVDLVPQLHTQNFLHFHVARFCRARQNLKFSPLRSIFLLDEAKRVVDIGCLHQSFSFEILGAMIIPG